VTTINTDTTSERSAFEAWIRRGHPQREYITEGMDFTAAFPKAWDAWHARAALASQPVTQAVEPVGAVVTRVNPKTGIATKRAELFERFSDLPNGTRLYAFPVPQPSGEMTDEQILALYNQHEEKLANGSTLFHFNDFARAILAARQDSKGEA